MPKIVITSRNQNKYREIKSLLKGVPFALIDGLELQPDLRVDEIGKTYFENAKLKAMAYSKATGMPALADDSGLEVKSLNGKPGVRSNRFFPIVVRIKKNRSLI